MRIKGNFETMYPMRIHIIYILIGMVGCLTGIVISFIKEFINTVVTSAINPFLAPLRGIMIKFSNLHEVPLRHQFFNFRYVKEDKVGGIFRRIKYTCITIIKIILIPIIFPIGVITRTGGESTQIIERIYYSFIRYVELRHLKKVIENYNLEKYKIKKTLCNADYLVDGMKREENVVDDIIMRANLKYSLNVCKDYSDKLFNETLILKAHEAANILHTIEIAKRNPQNPNLKENIVLLENRYAELLEKNKSFLGLTALVAVGEGELCGIAKSIEKNSATSIDTVCEEGQGTYGKSIHAKNMLENVQNLIIKTISLSNNMVSENRVFSYKDSVCENVRINMETLRNYTNEQIIKFGIFLSNRCIRKELMKIVYKFEITKYQYFRGITTMGYSNHFTNASYINTQIGKIKRMGKIEDSDTEISGWIKDELEYLLIEFEELKSHNESSCNIYDGAMEEMREIENNTLQLNQDCEVLRMRKECPPIYSYCNSVQPQMITPVLP